MKKFVVSILILAVTCGSCYYYYKTWTTESVLSKYGSRGQEVKDIQYKLAIWGYYKGKVDGVYGWRTSQAVRSFQKKNDLTVDGIAGPQTLAALGLPTGRGTTQTTTSRSGDVNLLARVINGEARGEPYIGQVAVGAVILNRVQHPSFPNTMAGVVYQPRAFTAITDGQVHANMQSDSIRAAQDALNGWDPSGGAIYYYNPAKTTSNWIYSRPVIKRIGKHVFAK
ncbi:spore cortex-lytic enzyme [Petroclostridium sp. X23]|uniref:spore cortex-lytic enzyme n=1 Tax=Petroclostridium sp. X23 TaxID=3045146 RepID=UPI0024AE7995|nr:spore cortex-lytic enzyme [Petroclostridium sp. X23]WHH59226.1 spore cortex-lytic enzyme [Petroclostridium sp. X23]